MASHCRYGEILESAIGIVDTTKTHILRKTGRDQKLPHAFEWSNTKFRLVEISPPQSIPFKFDYIGKVFEFLKTGSCQYQPAPLTANENPLVYFQKHLEIAKKVNATDILFPKTTFDLISGNKTAIGIEYALSVSDHKDLAIDFNGSSFLIPSDRGGFVFENTQRLSIKNLFIEWAKPGKENTPYYSGPTLHGFYSPRKDNSDLWFENITLKRVPGWGFYFDSIRGAFIANSNISAFSGESLPATREGAVKAINSQDIIVRNNTFKNLGGDGISLHGQFAVVATSPYLSNPTPTKSPRLSCVGMGSSWSPFAEEEPLGFFNEKMDFQGETSIKKITHFSFSDPKLPPYCKGFAHCSEICFTPQLDLTPVKAGFAASLKNNSSLFLITDNKLSEIAGRAITIQGSNGEISENIVNNSGGPGIQLSADLAHQLQGPGAFNILLKNNQLRHVVSATHYLQAEEPYFGGISIGATQKESDGRTVLIKAPLIQHILIEGPNSLVEDSGSVALLISSAKSIEVRDLTIGSAGLSRNLSSGSLSGSTAEGSILLTHCQQIDLAGLTTPPLIEKRYARSRTIVIDSQNVLQLRIPLSIRGKNGKSANTLWYTTFRSWFKDDVSKTPSEVNLILESPGLSTFHNKPPLEAFSIITPKVGDKESTQLGKPLPLNSTANRWISTGTLSWQSPNRIQLRPTFKNNYPNLFLSIGSANLTPKKQAPLPFES